MYRKVRSRFKILPLLTGLFDHVQRVSSFDLESFAVILSKRDKSLSRNKSSNASSMSDSCRKGKGRGDQASTIRVLTVLSSIWDREVMSGRVSGSPPPKLFTNYFAVASYS